MNAQTRMSVTRIATLLFAAVVALARACDGARALDGQGFNKFDAERGHRFASEDPNEWNAAKCSYVRKFLWKYREQLVDHHNIELEDIPDPNDFVHPRRVAFERAYGGQFLIAWDYNDKQFGEIKDAVKALEQRRYNGGTKVWAVPVELAQEVAELAERFGFVVDDTATSALAGTESIERPDNVTFDEHRGHIVFRFPYDPEMLSVLKSTWEKRRWDRDDRVWRVKLQNKEDYQAVAEFSERFNLTVSEEVRTMLASTFGVGTEEPSQEPTEEPQETPAGRPRDEDAPTDEELYGDAEGEPFPREDIEEYHERTEMGRNWQAGDAKKLFS